MVRQVVRSTTTASPLLPAFPITITVPIAIAITVAAVPLVQCVVTPHPRRMNPLQEPPLQQDARPSIQIPEQEIQTKGLLKEENLRVSVLRWKKACGLQQSLTYRFVNGPVPRKHGAPILGLMDQFKPRLFA